MGISEGKGDRSLRIAFTFLLQIHTHFSCDVYAESIDLHWSVMQNSRGGEYCLFNYVFMKYVFELRVQKK